MGGGFRFVLGAMLATAVLYAAFSVTPLLLGQRSHQIPAVTPSATLAMASPTGASAAGTLGANGAGLQAGASLKPQPSWTFLNERETDSSGVTWLYARQPVILRVEPGGHPHTAVCLTKAPLTILGGTRLWPLETEGEWVLVRSPSHLLGWVHQVDLDTSQGYAKRRY